MRRNFGHEPATGFVSELIRRAGEHGLGPDRVVLDPGLDLGKTWQQPVHLLGAMARFADLGHPLLLGASNKIFLGRLLRLGIDERAAASVAAAAIAVLPGRPCCSPTGVVQQR